MANSPLTISAQSEWMEYQKHADVMAPTVDFQVVQTQDGHSVFFSLGTDDVLYVTREIQGSSTGWSREDLSSSLASQFSGSRITAKAFVVSQNITTLTFDLALVVTANDVDHLYISPGNLNTDASWGEGVLWTAVTFDDPKYPSMCDQLQISDLFLLTVPAAGPVPAGQCYFVDIMRGPIQSNPSKLLWRYYIMPQASQKWNLHTLPIDIAAGTIVSCVGQRNDDPIPGIYTFGQVNGLNQLMYATAYNPFRPAVPPTPARLTIPTGATMIAAALNTDQRSNLFVSGSQGLTIFPSNQQQDHSSGILIIQNSITANATQLSAQTADAFTTIWGINPQGNLFYAQCQAGQEAIPDSWSYPVVVLNTVEKFAFYTNTGAGNNVLFAHISGQDIVQFTQNPFTSIWNQRHILLPSTAVNDMVNFNSFVTHITVTDANQIPQPDISLQLNAISPASVYVNDAYYALSPHFSVEVQSDATGAISIVQKSDNLAAVCYQLSLSQPFSGSISVNPASKALERLSTIKTAADLSAVKIPRSDGSTSPLVPNGTSPADCTAAAEAVSQLSQIASTLPSDGTTVSNAQTIPVTASMLSHATTLFSFKTHTQSQESEQRTAKDRLDTRKVTPQVLNTDASNYFAMKAGDLFIWIQNEVTDLSTIEVKVINGISQFFVTVGSTIYHAVLDSISAVGHAVDYILSKISIFVDDLIAWLGFIFQWNDIVRTHKVLKNIVTQYASSIVADISNMEVSVANAFDGLEDKVNTLTGITDPGKKIGEMTTTQQLLQNSPQSQWASQATKNNAGNAMTSFIGPTVSSSSLGAILEDLSLVVEDEVDAIENTISQIKSQVVDQFSSLTPVEVIKRVLGIISDLILKTAKNVIVKLVDVVNVIVQTILVALEAPISIPILSPKYKEITGDDLSFLDVICLVAAVPGTIIYKVVAGATPFPDNTTTTALIAAQDFASIKQLLAAPSSAGFAKVSHKVTVNGANTLSERNEVEDTSAFNPMETFFQVTETFSALLAAFFTNLKWEEDQGTEPKSSTLGYMVFANTLLGLGPSILAGCQNSSEWPAIMNDTVTGLIFLKAAADAVPVLADDPRWSNASPFLDTVLNAVSIAPVAGAYYYQHDADSDGTTLGACLAACLGGALSPLYGVKASPKPVQIGALTAFEVLSGCSAVLDFTTAVLLIEAN